MLTWNYAESQSISHCCDDLGKTCWQKTRLSSANSLRVINAWLPTDNRARQDAFNDFSRLSARTTWLVHDDCQAPAERAPDLELEGLVCILESDVAIPDRLIKQAAVLMEKLNKKWSTAKKLTSLMKYSTIARAKQIFCDRNDERDDFSGWQGWKLIWLWMCDGDA